MSSLVENLLTYILEEIMSVVQDNYQERKQQKRIENSLRDEIGKIIDFEKDNPNYNELSKLIYNSRIIADIVSRGICGESKLDFNQRIDDYVKHGNYRPEQIMYFKSVYKRISDCVEGILVFNMDSSNKVLLHQFTADINELHEETQEIKECLSQLIPTTVNDKDIFKISSLNGQDKPSTDGISIIIRKVIINEKNSEKQESAFVLSEIIKYKHILIVGDAGCGKSFAIYQLYDEAFATGIHVIYYALPYISSTNTLDIISQEKVEIDQQTILLLDGYDELSEEKKKYIVDAITSIVNRYPNVAIVISSRGNAINDSISKLDFAICSLSPLEKSDIVDYLNQNGIDSNGFLRLVLDQDLYSFCSIPFYLQELVILWKQCGLLPSKSALMKTIVQSRMRSDSERYSKTQINIQQRILLQTKNLERIALVMQCMQRQSLSITEIGQIANSKDFSIEYYSICVRTSEFEWCFSHNIFREYYAALALSRFDFKRILGFICNPYDKSKVRRSWYNVLAFLLSECFRSDLIKYESLLNWLIKCDVNTLFFCETDKINEEVRTSVFKQLLDECKHQNTWIDHNLFYDSHFSLFACTPNAIEYILDEMTLEISIKQKQNLLRCLAHFSPQNGFNDCVVKLIWGIVSDSNSEVLLRADAAYVMSKHADDFIGFAKDTVDLFNAESEVIIRYRIVQFWKSIDCCEEYFELVLNEYSKISEEYSYQKLLSTIIVEMKSVHSAEIMLSYLISNQNASFSLRRLNVITKCCSIGIEAHKNKLKNKICDLLLQYLNNSFALSNDDYDAIKMFMTETKREELFFHSVLLKAPNAFCVEILGYIMCDAFLEIINRDLQNQAMDLTIVRDLAQNINVEITYRRILAQIYYKYSNELIELDTYSSREEKKCASYQKYIEALFNKDKYVEVVRCILSILGEDATVGKEVKSQDYDGLSRIYAEPYLKSCWFDLRFLSRNDERIGLFDCLNRIKNWGYFRLHCLNRILENESSKIEFSSSQLGIVEKQVQSLLQSFDYNMITVKENTITYPSMLPECLRAMRLFRFECPAELGEKLVTVPIVLFDDRDHYDSFPSWLLDSVDRDFVCKLIIKRINEKKLNSLIAPTYIKYCIDNNLMECKSSIIEYILDSEYNKGFYSYGIEYISKLFGVGVLLSEVMPFCMDDEVLLSITSYIPIDVHSDELEKKLWDIYIKTKNMDCLARLIARSNYNAIEEYYSLARNMMSLPDNVPEPAVPALTHAISNISNLQCADILIKLFLLAIDKEFNDQKDFGLKYCSLSALRNIACCNGETVIAKLKQNITHDDPYTDSAINELLENIYSDLIKTSDIPMSFEQAMVLVS